MHPRRPSACIKAYKKNETCWTGSKALALVVLGYKIGKKQSPQVMSKATRQTAAEDLKAFLSRPDTNLLQEQILEVVKTQNMPTTAEAILAKLKEKEQFNVYMSDISRAIWRMASAGLIAVESGKIHTIPLVDEPTIGDKPAHRTVPSSNQSRQHTRQYNEWSPTSKLPA
jgi:hypothetical protein